MLSNFKQKLKENYGHFCSDDIEEMIKEFGEDFIVVIKFYGHDKIFTSLKRLKMFPLLYPELDRDIREVYMPSDVYLETFDFSLDEDSEIIDTINRVKKYTYKTKER
jgi:hypothetical protein